MTRNRYSLGILLIAIAIVLLLGKLGVFTFLAGLLWPLIILGIGVVLHALVYTRLAPSGLIVVGGMLVTYSLLFIICNIVGWSALKYLWPLFIFGVAVGLYELHLYDRYSPKSIHIAALLLALLSAALFVITLLFSMSVYWIAFILVAVGAGFILWRPRRMW